MLGRQHLTCFVALVGGAALASLGACSSVDATGSAVSTGGPSSEAGDVPRQEFVGNPRDYQTSLAKCFSDRGFPSEVVVTEQGDLAVDSAGVNQQTMRDYLEVDQMCTETLPPPPEPRSDSDLAEYYTSWSAQHECLTQAGYDIPSLPTLQTFTATFRSGELASSPVSLVEGPQQSGAAKLCPPDNDHWW